MKSKEVFPGVFSRHARAYWDRILGYSLEGRRAVVERVAPGTGERVLDLACGPGTITLLLSERVGPAGEVVAADLAPGMLDVLRESAPGNVRVRLMDLEQLDFPDAAFDVVTCAHGYQFATDLRRALAEARRVLRPGGRFAASLPDGGASRGIRSMIEAALSELPPAPRVPDREETLAVIRDPGRLREAVTRAGFQGVRVTRHAEETEYRDVDSATERTFSWWDCAWRLEQVEPEAQARIRERYRSLVRETVSEWPLRTTSYTLVVSGSAG